MKIKNYIKELKSIIDDLKTKDSDMDVEYLTHCIPDHESNSYDTDINEKSLSEEIADELKEQHNERMSISNKIISLLKNNGFKTTAITIDRGQITFNVSFEIKNSPLVIKKEFSFSFRVGSRIRIYKTFNASNETFLKSFWFEEVGDIIPCLKIYMIWVNQPN